MGFLPPMTDTGGMEGFGFGLPVVKGSRDTNCAGGRVDEFKADGHQLGAGGIVVIVIMFHGG